MKNIFPANPIVEVLNVKKDSETGETVTILFTPLTEEQTENFTTLIKYYNTFPKNSERRRELGCELLTTHKLSFRDILALGDTAVNNKLANIYIESTDVKVNGEKRKSYKCFVNKDWKEIGMMNLPYHEDGSCSWNCLMAKMKHPEFGIIYSVTNQVISNFVKDEQYRNYKRA